MTARRITDFEQKIDQVVESSEERLLLVLHMHRKREFMLILADRLERFSTLSTDEMRNAVATLPREIRSQIRDFDHLTEIERTVNILTSNFVGKLKKLYRDLTSTELLVATYVRAGLTAAQTASVMFVSVRAIEKHRQSIRRKLDLAGSEDLRSWFIDNIR
jgi:DNA-binding CsgD family transcriptional regulator